MDLQEILMGIGGWWGLGRFLKMGDIPDVFCEFQKDYTDSRRWHCILGSLERPPGFCRYRSAREMPSGGCVLARGLGGATKRMMAGMSKTMEEIARESPGSPAVAYYNYRGVVFEITRTPATREDGDATITVKRAPNQELFEFIS